MAPSDSSAATASPGSDHTLASPRRLRLIEGHEHTWQLRSIDFLDGTSVREFGCGSCDSVWFD